MEKQKIIDRLLTIKKEASEMKLQDQKGNDIGDENIKEVVSAVFNKAVDLSIQEIEELYDESSQDS